VIGFAQSRRRAIEHQIAGAFEGVSRVYVIGS
jgi:hypothetical protein